MSVQENGHTNLSPGRDEESRQVVLRGPGHPLLPGEREEENGGMGDQSFGVWAILSIPEEQGCVRTISRQSGGSA